MLDLTELVLGALAVVLAGAAIMLGARVIRDTWHAGFKNQGRDPERPAGSQEQSASGGRLPPPRVPDRAARPRLRR